MFIFHSPKNIHEPCILFKQLYNHVCGVMVSVLATSAVNRVFEARSGQTIDIVICCYSTKHALLFSKNKHWLAQNQDYVTEWSDMSINGLLFHELAL